MNQKLTRSLFAVLMAGGISFAINLPTNVPAATIVDVNALWPTAPDVQTIDALSVVNANRGISGTRIDRQSFTNLTDINVGTIYLSASSYNSNAFTISIFQATLVNSNNLVNTTGAQIGNTITVAALGSAASGNRNLEIVLDPSEQFFLPGVAAPAGYIIAIQLADTTTPAAFNWVHANTGVDIYTGGRYRRDDGDQTNTRDFGVAFVAVPVPEPTSLALFAVAGAALAIRRRKSSAN